MSYVYDRQQRQLAIRLADLRQAFEGVTISAAHAPLDFGTCMETLVRRGEIASVVRLADAIVAETGVHHGHLNLVPIEVLASA